MTQAERRSYLIQYLLKETEEYNELSVPRTSAEQKSLLRALFNIRMPKDVTDEFIQIQNEYLQEEIRENGITDYKSLTPLEQGVYLWQGDISTLKVGAIVNAANSQMLGCFHPNHKCIDNCIHTFAGIQLRKVCMDLMIKQGREEETGKAKITPAYNLELGVGMNTPVLCSLRTTRKLANNTRKQQAFGHTHGTFENQKERRCA